MTPPLWTSWELSEATGGRFSAPFDASGISIDTRSLAEGDMFVALVGDNRDGHAFVLDAVARGAAGLMLHADPVCALTVLRVDDTLAALARLGGFARARFGDGVLPGAPAGKLVAITGSVGKTTTKEMLRAALAAFGPTYAATASYNNHWGVPLTLACIPREARFCVAEIGMNHAGEIAPLARLARPHVAVITTIAKAHLGQLGSIEAIADEKATIMQGLEPHGLAVLPADEPLLPRLRAAARDATILTFGVAPGADVRVVYVNPDADGSDIELQIGGQIITLRLNAPGRHMVMNAVAALSAVAALGLDPIQAISPLETFRPLVGRGARRSLPVGRGTALVLDESYNSNGASMRAALNVLRLQPARRRIAVLGDMLELGEAGPAEHVALSEAVIASVDRVFACGPLMRILFDNLPVRLQGAHARDSADLAPLVAENLAAGDAILVKGSLGSRMKLVVQAIEAAASTPLNPARAN